MLGNEQEIQKYYDDLMNSRNNQYNQLKQSTGNQYQAMYKDLQNQTQDAQQSAYADRNQIAVDNSQKVQQLRDYMANHNLLQSGENVDAQLRANTDYSNRIGENKTNEANAMRSLSDRKNQYAMQEQGAYNDLTNQYTNDTNDINYKRMNEINALRQYQQQQAASRASASRSSSTSSEKSQQTAMKNQAWVNFQHEFNDGTAGTWLQENTDDLIGYLGVDEYNKMLKQIKDNADQQLYAKRTSNYRVGDGGRMLAE